ncbi:hypothetical protein TSMEX_009571 [Taenia solium]|eukprot:TsM_000237100 transcript=TsM_000237100 gene=TsM_000237100
MVEEQTSLKVGTGHETKTLKFFMCSELPWKVNPDAYFLCNAKTVMKNTMETCSSHRVTDSTACLSQSKDDTDDGFNAIFEVTAESIDILADFWAQHTHAIDTTRREF